MHKPITVALVLRTLISLIKRLLKASDLGLAVLEGLGCLGSLAFCSHNAVLGIVEALLTSPLELLVLLDEPLCCVSKTPNVAQHQVLEVPSFLGEDGGGDFLDHFESEVGFPLFCESGLGHAAVRVLTVHGVGWECLFFML